MKDFKDFNHMNFIAKGTLNQKRFVKEWNKERFQTNL